MIMDEKVQNGASVNFYIYNAKTKTYLASHWGAGWNASWNKDLILSCKFESYEEAAKTIINLKAERLKVIVQINNVLFELKSHAN